MEKQNIFKRIANAIRGETRSATNCEFLKLDITDRILILNGITNSMFNIPEIRTAINLIAEIFSTIPMYHRRMDTQGNFEYLESNINFTINKMPNTLQTKTSFWITVITQLLINNNVAVLPHWTRNGDLEYLEPMPSKLWTLDEKNGNYYVIFANENLKYPVEEVILLSRFCTLEGGTKNQAISLHQSIMQAIQKRAEQNAINPKIIQAYVKIKQGNMKPEAAKARAKEIADQMVNNTEGQIPVIQGDVDLEKIDISAIPVDKELLTEVTETVYNYFGLTKNIIQRKASEIENEMFLTTTIKPIANQVSEEFSKKLFTRRELQVGNWIELDLTALQVATLSSKTSFFQAAIPYGIINPDEAREYIGFGRIPNGLGESYMQTLNLIKKDVAIEYQMNMAKNGTPVTTTTQTEANAINQKENNNA